nr:hypothetical protein [Tanacetum cinerariifolium]
MYQTVLDHSCCQDVDVVLEDDKEVVDEAKEVAEEAKGRQAESQAEIYKIDLDHANKVLSMQEDETEAAEVQEVVDVVTTAKLITEVVTAASETITAAKFTTSTIIPTETKSKDKGKGILVEEPKPLKKKQQIEQDEKYARELEAELNTNIDWDEAIDHVKKKAKKDNAAKRYQAMKRKPRTKAQARKNIMVYLKNVAGFKMDYFKGIRGEQSTKKITETPAKRAAKRQKLDEEVEELKRYLQIVPNEDDDVYREDMEALWSLVKEIFSTTKPKNFSDDFLLVTIGAMFEKPNIHAQIWKNQRNVHSSAKVKGWKLLESCVLDHSCCQDVDVVLEDDKEVVDEAKEVAEEAKVDESVDIQGRQAESQAEIYKIDLDHLYA